MMRKLPNSLYIRHICVLQYPIFQGRQQYTKINHLNMYLLIEIRHNSIKQCHGNYVEAEKLQLPYYPAYTPHPIQCSTYVKEWVRVISGYIHQDFLHRCHGCWDMWGRVGKVPPGGKDSISIHIWILITL